MLNFLLDNQQQEQKALSVINVNMAKLKMLLVCILHYKILKKTILIVKKAVKDLEVGHKGYGYFVSKVW